MIIYNDKYCVYLHRNIINGKIYVGQTSMKPEDRYGKNGRGYKGCTLFYKAIQKYGWDNFEHEIIASNLTKEESDNFERLLIDKLGLMNHDKGYNLKDGGSHGKHSEETKRKISEKNKGDKNSMYGVHRYGKENPNYNRRHTEEEKKKMKENHADFNGKNNPHAKSVNQYDKDWNFIYQWDCVSQAEKELGILHQSIIKCCKKKRKTAGGYCWQYAV